jgi:predicted peptidase
VKKKSSILASLALAVIVAPTAHAQGMSGFPRHVKSATAVGEVFGNGEKLSAVIVEYDRDIDQARLAPAAFAVAGRTITAVYSNNTPAKASRGTSGRYVVVELSPNDKDASLFSGGPGSGLGPGSPGPGGPGVVAARKPLKVTVAQVGEITTAAGEKFPASAPFDTDRSVNLIVDEFKQFEFKDPATGMTLAYNLFIPKNYDRNKSYPLVLFMHDASVTGAETTRTLTQGLGAVVWATPSEQAKHPAFVLAPAFARGVSTEGAVGDATGDTVVDLVNSVVGQYSIDKSRVYTTGQSFGCMLSLAIMIRHPDLFAASMRVAGQRDAQATSVLNHTRCGLSWPRETREPFRA